MLSTLLWLPIIGAIIVGLFPDKFAPAKLRQITLFFVAAVLFWSLYLLTQYNLTSNGFQFSEYREWAKPIGLSYNLGVDGLSLPLIILNCFLTGIAIYSSEEKIDRPRLYYILIP